MNLWKKISCLHDYEQIKTVRFYERESDSLPIYRKTLFKCKKCGKFKQVKM